MSRIFLALQVLFWGSSFASVRAADAPVVEQWGIFDVAFNGPTNGNPFLEVDLATRFVRGTNSVEVAGFYDGDGIYRVRFMPETQGEWHYETKSNVRALSGQIGVFNVGAPAANNHGKVHVANTFHFSYADGTPFHELGTTSYGWAHQGDALEEQTLRTLATAPFNKIRMCVFPMRKDKHAQHDSELYPFVGNPPNHWDFTRFNPQYFQHLEKRIGQLRDLGIEADVILFHPYDKGHWGFDRMGAAADDRYVRYVVARFAAYRNVWWSLANEYDLMREKNESDWDRIFQLIQQTDPYTHLRSIHNAMTIYNNSLLWVTHASIQNGSAAEDAGRAELYRDVWRKPVVFDEVKYEGNSPRRWGQLSAEEMVHRFWEGLVAGTYVGHSEIFQNPTNNWMADGGFLRGQSAAHLTFLRQVMADGPRDGIDPIDKWQYPQIGGQAGSYYLIYFGKEQPTNWVFELPAPRLSDDLKFKVEILDTWNGTVTPVDEVFVTKKNTDYTFADVDGRGLQLPGKPWLALRIQGLPR